MKLAKSGEVPIHAINWKDQRAAAVTWLRELGDPYSRIGHDFDNKAGIEWGVYGVPETYVIDREGRIRYKHVGPLFPETYAEVIAPLLKELRG
jgi:cytochrome c biogenesis protein CcmG/thiol:disulfide interchange protein DsbE